MNPDASTLIEEYLLGKLDAAEARAVEQRAETDAAFARELQLQGDILTGIELYGEEKIKAAIAGVDKNLEAGGFFEREPPVARWSQGAFKHRYRMAAAAIALLCLGMGVWWWANRKPVPPAAAHSPVAATPSPGAVTETATPGVVPADPQTARRQARPGQASAYLQLARAEWAPPDFSNIRAAETAVPALFTRAAAAFQQKDYAAVIRMLAPVRPGDPNYWPVSEMYAHACFLDGKTALAAERFRQIAASGQLPFSERAEWHLLLCRLADWPRGKTEFDALMEKIRSDEGHPYFKKAEALKPRVRG